MSGKSVRYKVKPSALRKLGLALTAVWVGVTLYLASRLSAPNFGTVLAYLATVVFLPPALLWLIWAVSRQLRMLRMLQGQLHLQIEESQRLVVQQKRVDADLRALREDQIRRDRETALKALDATRPLLKMKAVGVGGTVEDRGIVHFRLLNHGRTCTDVVLSFDRGHAPQEFGRLADGAELPFNLALPTGAMEPVGVTVRYLDQQLRRGSKRFIITGGESSYEVHEVADANSA